MTKLKRIVAIHDISGLGKCALTVVLPVISASGVECSVIPTALLSTHTGEFKGYTFRDLSDDMLPIAEHWRRENISVDGIYSGYLASAQQARDLERIIDLLASENTKLIVDPVMADNGAYYTGHGEDMCSAFRRLCSKADVITPNITEAALLTGLEYRHSGHDDDYISALMDGLKKLCGGVIAITGVRPREGCVGVATLDARTGERCMETRPVSPGVFVGVGDIFASAFSALIVRGAQVRQATEAALGLVAESIENTVKSGTPRRFGVEFEPALKNYVNHVGEMLG